MGYEYLTWVVALDPGPKGETTRMLGALGTDGWEVVSTHIVPATDGSPLDPYAPEKPCLLVICKRPRKVPAGVTS